MPADSAGWSGSTAWRAPARIRDAHVLVAGIGGVGSWAVEALARSGVGRLTLIDLDHIAESNINRQIHALDDTVGQAKVEAMRERIGHINPACKVLAIDEFVEPGNWRALLGMAERRTGRRRGHRRLRPGESQAGHGGVGPRAGVVLHHRGRGGGKRLAHKVDIDDLSLVTHDPLLAQLRQRLRKDHGAPREGRKIGIDCVFSRESVAPPDASCAIEEGDGTLNCHGYGSVVSVTATFGQCAAGWVLDRIASKRRAIIYGFAGRKQNRRSKMREWDVSSVGRAADF